MNKELTKEEAEEFYNKLWLENKELIQDNMNKLSMERFELELELVDKNKEIERLNKCYCERTDCSGRIKNSKKYESMQEEIERLNNRLKTSNDTCNYLRNIIDKAIEYMDRRDLEWGSDEHNKMMDILKGSDK